MHQVVRRGEHKVRTESNQLPPCGLMIDHDASPADEVAGLVRADEHERRILPRERADGSNPNG